MRSPDEMYSRARLFSRWVESFLADFESEDPSDLFAADWLRDEFVTYSNFIELIMNETQKKHVQPRGPILLVTPGTGRTTGIVAFFWAWLVSEGPVTLGISSHDPFLDEFITYVNEEDVKLVRGLSSYGDDQLEELVRRHRTVIVYGSDWTIERYRTFSLPDTRFVGYGSKFSIGVHIGQINELHLKGYLRDLTIYDGLGCLNTSILYVDKLTYEIRVGLENLSNMVLAHYANNETDGPTHFQSQFTQGVFESGFEELTPIFGCRKVISGNTPLPMGYGTLYVVDLDGDLDGVVRDLEVYRQFLSSATVAGSPEWEPEITQVRKLLAEVGVQRITTVGQSQSPKLDWSHDGYGNITPFVTLLDLEY